MRKTVALVVGWLLAGFGAVALATVAVGAVGDQLTGDRPAALSATEVRAELDQAAATTTSSPGRAEVGASSSTTSVTIGDRGGQADDSGRGTDDRGAGTAPSTTAAGGSTTPASTTKTFKVVGGTVTLRFSASGVTVVTATPNAGYAVNTEPEHGNGVRVEFENDSHRSRVSGWWDGGPRSETREDTSGGGDDGGSGGGGPG